MFCFEIFPIYFFYQSHSLLKSMITLAIYISADFHVRCTAGIIASPPIWKAAKYFLTVKFILFLLLAIEKNEKYRHVYFSDDLSHTQTLKSYMPPNQNITEKL